MGRSLRSVTNLTVAVTHESHRSSRTKAKVNRMDAATPVSCPASFATITRTVCTMLAPALPSLQMLALEGCCHDAALGAFGTSCPQLVDLCVEAVSFPVKALKGVEKHLPNLNCFTLSSPQQLASSQRLTDYVGSCFRALQACTLLTRIALELDSDDRLECKPGSWQQVPPSVREFVCLTEILCISNAQALLGILHTLDTINTYERGMLLRILENAPNLKQLSLSSDAQVQLCCNHVETMTGLAMLRDFVSGGLVLETPRWALEGSSSSLQEALALLPRMPCVEKCDLRFYSDPERNCLSEVPRVFPKITRLGLVSHMPWEDNPGTGIEMLGPLAACDSLRDLNVQVQLDHSTSELVDLCLSIPTLTKFGYMACIGASVERLGTLLAAKGRTVLVNEF